jgi:hypothetical protein
MRRRTALLLAALAALLVAAAPAHALTIGIADQKPDMFADGRFEQTGIRHARLSVGWDAMGSPWQVAQIDQWLAAARADGVVPLISFGHSRTARRALPTPERFLYEFRRFRARYPWVRDYATWNEANHCGEPTCHRPVLVAAYYRKLKRDCPKCRILAAELLDMPNMVSWVKQFRRAARGEPRYWGLHNYLDANRFRTSGTTRLLEATKGQVWLTEVGGIVARRGNPGKVGFEESTRHSAQAIRWVFDELVPLSPRITSVYVYHWNADSHTESWDSALIGPGGHARPALEVVEREVTLEKARRAAAAAKHK